ncbi:MAG: tRNA (5-methylaminomethyl-2-thiouridine)(34)-methyltransferase MnmD [Methylotenera sp.]|nr:tRNA (5-methylaminomethyl-2-thiouridine)(34)-methyltransferase MnmD [Methylotenera sp.]
MLPGSHAKLSWRNGLAYSEHFQDVYYNSDNGLLESDYVFLQANRLAERWLDYSEQSFTIAETGFGTGLNFLLAVKLWLALAPSSASLHFISAEKYPLNLHDMTTAWQQWPELQELSDVLTSHYPQALQEMTLNLFQDRVRLSLLIGDATNVYRNFRQKSANTKVDAWFLDGFSPAKNPAMWQAALLQEMALLSKPPTSFATFTSASAVRRELMAVGFNVNKQVGFAKKREMLYGHFTGTAHAQ